MKGPASVKAPLTISDTLLDKVNEIHHTTWMVARDISRLFDPEITIRPHQTHKERSLLSAEEIAANNAQVQAYAVTLANMPQEAFDWLVVNSPSPGKAV